MLWNLYQPCVSCAQNNYEQNTYEIETHYHPYKLTEEVDPYLFLTLPPHCHVLSEYRYSDHRGLEAQEKVESYLILTLPPHHHVFSGYRFIHGLHLEIDVYQCLVHRELIPFLPHQRTLSVSKFHIIHY